MTHQDNKTQGPGKPIVLIVDDVPDNLAAISEMISNLGVDVRVANSGPVALRYARLPPHPDLILLDVMMPEMDGHEVLRALRADGETCDIPVIFVTALDDPENEERGIHEGAVDYITKPINPAILGIRVKAQLELKRARDMVAGQKAWLEQEVARRVAENTQLDARLQVALATSGFGIWEHDHERGSNQWSPSLSRILGLTEGPTTIAATLELIHPEDRNAIAQSMEDQPGHGDEIHVEELRMRHADGHWVWMEARGRILRRDAQGKAALVLGTMADISRRKTADAEQRLSSVVFTGISDGVCITDANSEILLTNQAFSKVTGYSSSEALGKNPRILRSGVHGPEFYRDMWEAINRHGNWQGEITNRRKDGELVTEWLNISAVRDRRGNLTNYVGVFSDLSERHAAAERIQYLSSFDPLTNLPNRSLFADRLGQALISAHRFNRETAVLLLDLDRFRFINDTLGPPVGDAILIEVARRLNLQVRDGDTIGRRSGNEFGFVMANLSHERDTIALAQRMLDAIAVPFEVGEHTIAITACIGVAVAPRNGNDVDALMKCADAALLRTKKSGQNTFRFYSPEMDADAARRLGLEAALRQALQRNELTVYYQPQISLDSGNMIGMEALLRWNNPAFGSISPAEFIPIAEETGLILPIGEWVLRTACLQTRQWLDLGLANLRIAVNLSSRQFRQANLPGLVSQCLAETGLPAGALELEITESALIDDIDEAIAQCRSLKTLGIKISLDDFGTGYSSLAYISRLPFDKIKIDQSFVRDITENPVNAAIASAAIVMARSLNLSVLAEGVETEAQASFLRSRRCDAMQGYLFSRPLPAAEFEQLLAGKKRLQLADTPAEKAQTLLIVDDEPNILTSLSRLLRREGFNILTANSPAAAFEHLAKHPVQVILSDQRMPDMSGTEFFARVRQLYPDTIRIVLTGYTDIESVTGAINRGAIYKFLTKPWDDDMLREQIREAFRIAKG
ncbi:EAL domain-containing protein [Ferribacterium limneticum]|uniref:EAL domain-containing protein n=1 Tax=Ferribacterium limneticum TaxID=76259 RepID=UPI001CFA33E8|nr:EAL domain-containing protein [Ferribacterium limneticum]UCV18620.1 EAL domain-containing protein [Ferribacterium limneticum]